MSYNLDHIDYSINENKTKMNEYFEMLMCNAKDTNEDLYKHIKCEIYEVINGKKITDDFADKWVNKMSPKAKWTKDEINNVAMAYQVDIPLNSAYIIMNMLYSDYKDVYGDGNTEESILEYIKGTKDFYNDSDAKYKGEEKLYEYGKHIIGVYM